MFRAVSFDFDGVLSTTLVSSRCGEALCLVLMILLLTLSGCSDEMTVDPQQGGTLEISNLISPDFLYLASPGMPAISVLVTHPGGLDSIKQVEFGLLQIAENRVTGSGFLLDTGQNGDIIPGDGVYSGLISASLAGGLAGEFELEVTATDLAEKQSNTLIAVIQVLEGAPNLAPQIVAVNAPATVAVDSSFSFLLTARVSDPEGLSDITSVHYQFFLPAHPNPTDSSDMNDDGIMGDSTAGDGIYTVQLRSDMFDQAADYFFRLEANDHAGNVSEPQVIAIRGYFIGNRPPVISNLVAPDTVQIDPNRVVQIRMMIDVSDPQGLADIDFVRFRSFLPDGNEAQNSPFELADDGNEAVTGDELAGDGTFSIIINLPSTGVQRGNFRFVFQAQDQSQAVSNEIVHIMTVID